VLAIANVLSNALESFPSGRTDARVDVTACSNGEHAVLRIRDNGCGMDDVASPRRPYHSLKKEQGGIGLGLPLAINIVEREHEGSLVIESEPGKGTTVTIKLPLKRQEETE